MQGAFQIPVNFDTGTNKIVVGDGNDFEPLSLPAYTGGDASFVTAVLNQSDGGSVEESASGKRIVRNDPALWPMRAPTALSSPPTFTNGVANAASAIAGSILHSAFDKRKISYFGGPVNRGLLNPNYFGIAIGEYPYKTSAALVSAEFTLDTTDATGRFEIYGKGSGAAYRVLVRRSDGSWGYVTQFATRSTPADGNLYYDLVTLGSAGTYVIRIEFEGYSKFFGIQTKATDTVSATTQKRRRYIVVGDSFTEPTISDTGSKFLANGFVPQLAYLTGLDIWSAGSGGTGYVEPNAAGGRVKFRDRLSQDILAFKPDGVIFAGGINDLATSPEAVGAEAAACFAMCEGLDLIVLSPFWPKGMNLEASPTMLPAYRDAIKTEAQKVGAQFLDLLDFGVPDYLLDEADFSTYLTSPYVSGLNISVSDVPDYFKQVGAGYDGFSVKLGSGNTQYIRSVVGLAGTGPYTLTLSNAPGLPVAAGSRVSLCGESYMTGSGKQGTTTGDGNADIYTGPDATHPTNAGGQHIARCVAYLWSRTLAGR